MQVSDLAKEMAPIVASIVTRELLKEGSGIPGAHNKPISKKRGQLKNAIKAEKEAEDSRERNIILVRSVQLNHNSELTCSIETCSRIFPRYPRHPGGRRLRRA
jgi:hypothetical protein